MVEVIKNVLGSGLLGDSPARLAVRLGYPSRSTIYRLMRGQASQGAIASFCERLERQMHIGAAELRCIDDAIDNANHLRRLMKREMCLDHPDWRFQALLAFIVEDYSHFSPRFRQEQLPGLAALRSYNPDAFYLMLAYFYIKGIELERDLPDALRRLSEVFPEREVAMRFVRSIEAKLASGSYPTSWDLVRETAAALQAFADLGFEREMSARYFLLQGLGYASTWQQGRIIMVSIEAEQAGTGFYEVFARDADGGSLRYLFRLNFAAGDVVFLFRPGEVEPVMGIYRWDGTSLELGWEPDTGDPTGVGTEWQLTDGDAKVPLGELRRLCLRAWGAEDVADLRVVDVVISREDVTLHLADGSTRRFAKADHTFLTEIRADDAVVALRDLATGAINFLWPRYGCHISDPVAK